MSRRSGGTYEVVTHLPSVTPGLPYTRPRKRPSAVRLHSSRIGGRNAEALEKAGAAMLPAWARGPRGAGRETMGAGGAGFGGLGAAVLTRRDGASPRCAAGEACPAVRARLPSTATGGIDEVEDEALGLEERIASECCAAEAAVVVAYHQRPCFVGGSENSVNSKTSLAVACRLPVRSECCSARRR